MALVDTPNSVRFLANPDAIRAELDLLLERDEVAGHELVYGELLMGDSAGRVQRIRRVPSVVHTEVATSVRSLKLQGRGNCSIDAHLLASAVLADTPLWTADERSAPATKATAES